MREGRLEKEVPDAAAVGEAEMLSLVSGKLEHGVARS
jgi:hypothetical protein